MASGFDSGYSSGFGATFVWDNEAADSLYSSALNWVGDVTPGAADIAEHTATSVADATVDISDLRAIHIQTEYTGDITLANLLSLSDDLRFGTNASSIFNTNGNDLYVDGNYCVSGPGEGLEHNSGGTVYLGADIIMASTVFNRPDAAIRIHHSKATPTVAKSHNLNANENTCRPQILTIGQNQTIVLTNGWVTDDYTFETGSIITDDGVTIYTIRMNGTLVTPGNATWLATALNQIVLQYVGTSVPVAADYGNLQIDYTINATLTGTHTTIGDMRFRGSVVQLNFTLAGTINTGELFIGNESNTSRGSDVDLSGVLNVSNDATLHADDGASINRLTLKTGSTSSFGGSLILESGATLRLEATLATIPIALDLTLAASAILDAASADNTIQVGRNLTISATATCAFGTLSVQCLGTGDLSNPTFANAFYDLAVAAAGFVTTLTDNTRQNGDASGGFVSFGGGTLDFDGNALNVRGEGAQCTGMDLSTLIDTAGGGSISYTLEGDMTHPGGSNFPSGTISNAGSVPFEFKILSNYISPNALFISADPTELLTLNIDGLLLSITFLNFGFGTQSAILALGTAGTLTCTTIRANGPNNSITGTGTINCSSILHDQGSFPLVGRTLNNTGDYTPAADATVSLDGTGGTMNLSGDYNGANVTANWSATWGSDGILTLNAAAAQDVFYGGKGEPANLNIKKTGGSVTMPDGPINGGTLLTCTAISADQTLTLTPGVAYSLTFLMTFTSGGNKTLFRSSTPGVQYDIIVDGNSTAFGADFEDCNIIGGIIEVDTTTGTDSGNNTLSDGVTDGLLFKEINLPTDLDIFMRRVSRVTIDRRGESLATLRVSPLYTGDDWSLEVNVTDNDTPVNLAAATITAAVISDGNTALIAATVQSSATIGANWAAGVVIVVFQAAQTAGIDPAQNAWLEVQIDDGVNVYTLPREQLQIVKGVIA